MKACVYFHQGWSDIVNCLSLINYYNNYYDEIYVIIRKDAKELVDYYIKSLQNVKIIYINNDDGRFYGNFELSNDEEVKYLMSESHNFHGTIQIGKNIDLLFHGEHDVYRMDHFRYNWYLRQNENPPGSFLEKFYTIYNIDYLERINSFIFERDIDLEEKTYNKFISEYGDKYVIYHDNPTWNHMPQNIPTEIKFDNKLEGYNYVNLNKKSDIFFDYIKIFQNAKEIHLIDSLWACIYYLIDSKYGIFKDKIINVYCYRGHDYMFLYPKQNKNWIIKK